MHDTSCVQAIASSELDCYLESQAEAIAPDICDELATSIRSMKRNQIELALNQGRYFLQVKQGFKKLKDFKLWLEQQDFSWKDACKHIKLYQTFADFPLEQICRASVDTLFALLQPKYEELLEQLRSLPKWADTKIQELMQQFRQQHRKSKPKLDEVIEEPGSGWRRLPGGGRAYQLPLLHDDWLGTLIDASCKARNQTVAQLIRDMTLFFVEWLEVPGIDFFRSQAAEDFA